MVIVYFQFDSSNEWLAGAENPSQPAVTCLKLTIETLEQGIKYVQS